MSDPGENRRAPRWERRYVRRAKRGDRDAFAALYDTFAGPLYDRVLLPRLGSAAAAEDALADTFRTALERIATYEDRGPSIWHWLARIAANKANDQHRAAARSGRALTDFERLVGPLVDGAPPPGEVYARAVERDEARVHVAAAMERLNPRYRRAIELRFLEDRERAACAEALDVTVGTFDVVLLRALRAFRREWERAFGVRETPG